MLTKSELLLLKVREAIAAATEESCSIKRRPKLKHLIATVIAFLESASEASVSEYIHEGCLIKSMSFVPCGNLCWVHAWDFTYTLGKTELLCVYTIKDSMSRIKIGIKYFPLRLPLEKPTNELNINLDSFMFQSDKSKSIYEQLPNLDIMGNGRENWISLSQDLDFRIQQFVCDGRLDESVLKLRELLESASLESHVVTII